MISTAKRKRIDFCLSDKPKRARQNQGWPESAEENMERLKDAGIPMDRDAPAAEENMERLKDAGIPMDRDAPAADEHETPQERGNRHGS